jgi:hypothetical protein
MDSLKNAEKNQTHDKCQICGDPWSAGIAISLFLECLNFIALTMLLKIFWRILKYFLFR